MKRNRMKNIMKIDSNGMKACSTPTLTHRELAVLEAKPTVMSDRASVRWPRIKWKRIRARRDFKPKKKKINRKSHSKLMAILCRHGRQTHFCEDCGQQYAFLQVHHIDGNPNNNHVDNLLVLCGGCHADRHKIADLQGTKDWTIGTVKEI